MKIHEIIDIAQELSGKWTIPILLTLQESMGRFTPLQHRLGISPARLSDNLRNLENRGILARLSAYERRHPLLPEYRLTEKGLFLLEAAKAVRAAEHDLERGYLSEKSWNWPVILAIHHQCSRFQQIRKMLPEATPRIISMRIEELVDIELVDKLLVANPRPAFRYELLSSAEAPVEQLEADLLSIV